MKKMRFIALMLVGLSWCSLSTIYGKPTVATQAVIDMDWQNYWKKLQAQVRNLVHIGKDIYASYYVDAIALDGVMYRISSHNNVHKIVNMIKELRFGDHLKALLSAMLADESIIHIGEFKDKISVSKHAQIVKLELEPALKRFLKAVGLPEDDIEL